MHRFLTLALALTLLLASQVSVAAPAREKAIVLQAESASTRQETCADCYELYSELVCDNDVFVQATKFNDAKNRFPADTLVHLQPAGITNEDSNPDQAVAQCKSQLKPKIQLQPGAEVLAFGEWKERGGKLRLLGGEDDCDADTDAATPAYSVEAQDLKQKRPAAGVSPAQSATLLIANNE
jgi:hypothetical protein